MTVPSAEAKFLEFKAINEPWNLYKLEDGSTVKVRIIIGGVMKRDEARFALQSTNVFNVVPNPKFIGIPTPLRPGEKLDDFIEAEDLKILEKTNYWNEYEVDLENIKLSVKGEVVSISRTNRRDEMGIPVYTVNVQLLIKPTKKKKTT
jgi:hypothetical protein